MTTTIRPPLNRRPHLPLWWSAAPVSVVVLWLAIRLLPHPVDPGPSRIFTSTERGRSCSHGGQPSALRRVSKLVLLPLAVWVPKLQVIAVTNTLLLAGLIGEVLRGYPQTDRRTTAGLTAEQALIVSAILLGAQGLEPIRDITRFGQVKVDNRVPPTPCVTDDVRRTPTACRQRSGRPWLWQWPRP